MPSGVMLLVVLEMFVTISLVACQTSELLEPDVTPTPEPTSSTVFRSITDSVMNDMVSPTPMDMTGSGSAILEPFPISPTPVSQNVLETITQANLTAAFVGNDDMCGCDLLVGQCDVLCCCDNDCAMSSRRIFNCSAAESNLCLDFVGLFRSSLDQCSCADSSLLCVVREQDLFRLDFGDAVGIDSSEQFSNVESRYVLPSAGVLASLEQPSYNTQYMVGDPLLVLKNDTTSFFGILTIPAPFNGLHCHDGNPITYLIHQEHACERKLHLPSMCSSLSASLYYKHLFILNGPRNLRGTIPVTVSAVSCRQVGNADQPCQLASPTFDDVTNTCMNAILEVSYSVIHDGGGVLTGASVIFTIGNVAEDTLIQRFEVNFYEEASLNSSSAPLRRSGNPGYVDGGVILAGFLTEVDTVSITVDNTFWLHVKDSSRRCTDERARIPVTFRKDLYTTCLLMVSPADAIDNCAAIRQAAYSAFNLDITVTHVGMYGNSDPSNISQWIRIINETVEVSDEVFFQPLCSNVPTSVEITILYSNVGDFGNPQPVIVGARMIYFTQNIIPKLIVSGHLMMSTAVKFIDITAEASQVLLPIQGVIMELPRDFLYPFFFSHASLLHCNWHSYVVFVMLISTLIV